MGLILAVTPCQAADAWLQAAFDALCGRLPVLEKQVLAELLGEYLPVVAARDGIDLGRIRQALAEDVSDLLEKAAALQWGPLDYFSSPAFGQGSGCVLFFDRQALMEIDRRFDLHGLWLIRAPIAGETAETLDMQYFLLGQGKVIAGYPRAEKVRNRDYEFFGDRYRYRPYMSMAIFGENGRQGLNRIRTLSHPAADFEPFLGPWNAAITAMELDHGLIKVDYDRWPQTGSVKVRKIPINPR